jgi:two-component system response regulator AtoC
VGTVGLDEQITTALHEKLLGVSKEIVEVNRRISQLAPTNLNVLITGETGTGKDIAARLLHNLSQRSKKPFIKVNCPSVPESLMESELFGYERGAFTGAYTSRPGYLEMAKGGTLFLDEIGELTQDLQAKLCQLLDNEPFFRLGGTTPAYSNARIVAAVNSPLAEAVMEGRLRSDICFRLTEAVIQMPALRERRDDIPLLAEHFNYNMCKMLGRDYSPLAPDVIARLQTRAWKGNARELAGRVREYLTTGVVDVLFVETSGFDGNEKSAPGDGRDGIPHDPSRPLPQSIMPLREVVRRAIENAERELIEEALRHTLWNRRKAARLLKTSYSSLLRRIEAYKIGKS